MSYMRDVCARLKIYSRIAFRRFVVAWNCSRANIGSIAIQTADDCYGATCDFATFAKVKKKKIREREVGFSLTSPRISFFDHFITVILLISLNFINPLAK